MGGQYGHKRLREVWLYDRLCSDKALGNSDNNKNKNNVRRAGSGSKNRHLMNKRNDIENQMKILTVIDSAPSLGVYYFFVVDSVCPSVCLSRSFKSIDSSFLFLDGI